MVCEWCVKQLAWIVDHGWWIMAHGSWIVACVALVFRGQVGNDPDNISAIQSSFAVIAAERTNNKCPILALLLCVT